MYLTLCWKGQNESTSIFVVFVEVLIKQRYRASRKGRVRGDKEDTHSSLEHNPESSRRSVEVNKERYQ